MGLCLYQIATTLGYAKEVSSRGGRYGEPFPTLPDELVNPGDTSPVDPSHAIHLPIHLTAKSPKQLWAQRDLNPRPTD